MNIVCPVCGASYAAGTEYAGKTFNCSSCGAPLFVPAETTSYVSQIPAGAPADAPSTVSVKLLRRGSVYGFAATICGALWVMTELSVIFYAVWLVVSAPANEPWTATVQHVAACGAALIFSTLFFAGAAALFRLTDVAVRISGVRSSFGL